MADPARIAQLSVPFFAEAGVRMAPDDRGMQFLAGAMAMVTSSVDRLNQVPARLAFLFDFSPERALDDAQIRQELAGEGARAVVAALAEELDAAPRLDRDTFRAIANQVKARTGQKGKSAVSPHSAGADRTRGRAGARFGGADDRSGRGPARVGGHPGHSGLP